MERLSVFDIFKIGVGPSSSHTLGPWRAALDFIQLIGDQSVISIEAHLFGSLSKTGKGHATDVAIMLGLEGYDPTQIDTSRIDLQIDKIESEKLLYIHGHPIPFIPEQNIIFHNFALPFHPNGMTLKSMLESGPIEQTYYSIGGGFITTGETTAKLQDVDLPYPIDTGVDLKRFTESTGKPIWEIVYENEKAFRPEMVIHEQLHRIFQTMLQCVYKGCHTEGILPGGLNVQRRAQKLCRKLMNGQLPNNMDDWIQRIRKSEKSFVNINKWVSCFALAVNEENASLGRIVTSPTNGAAGVIPAVLMYHYCFGDYNGEQDLFKFFMTAGEIGSLFKKGATISAALGGCQAEIGVSSAMAAGGLTEVLGGTPQQVMMAAEIAMEHHIGLTCDPIKGLVQIPCIERNAMGAIKAITACNLALDSDPTNAIVAFDVIVKTMWETAKDMHVKYKETSEGGLAIHLPVALSDC
ncbi:MAG: L-serine ammonia-lyase [Bacteroidota bacterium]